MVCLGVVLGLAVLYVVVTVVGGLRNLSGMANAAQPGSGANGAAASLGSAGPGAPQLKLLSSRIYRDAFMYYVVGEVKNITTAPMPDVTATATFYTKDGAVAATSQALADFNPIFPRQTSSFKVQQPPVPGIVRAKVAFKYASGKVIPTIVVKPKPVAVVNPGPANPTTAVPATPRPR